MATTPLYALVYPTTANQITPLATHFANLASSAETAMATAQGRFIGAESARAAMVSPQRKEGAEFYATDSKREWLYDGTNWLGVDRGLYVVYPTSVVGGNIQTDGSVIPTASSNLSFNGAFTTRFRKYRLEYSYKTLATTGSLVRFRQAGTDKADANFYTWVQTAATWNGISSSSSSGTAQSVSAYQADYHYGYVEFTNPSLTGTQKFITTFDNASPQTGTTTIGGWSTNETGTYDGFTFGIGSTSFDTTINNRFKLYAYA